MNQKLLYQLIVSFNTIDLSWNYLHQTYSFFKLPELCFAELELLLLYNCVNFRGSDFLKRYKSDFLAAWLNFTKCRCQRRENYDGCLWLEGASNWTILLYCLFTSSKKERLSGKLIWFITLVVFFWFYNSVWHFHLMFRSSTIQYPIHEIITS